MQRWVVVSVLLPVLVGIAAYHHKQGQLPAWTDVEDVWQQILSRGTWNGPARRPDEVSCWSSVCDGLATCCLFNYMLRAITYITE
jgi:hypothetical protein